MPNARQSGESLWRFSLALYARPGVAEALIALQDRAGSDVNLTLFAAWLGAAEGYEISATELAAASAAAAPLVAIVAELRALRRRLRPVGGADVQALRRRILAQELAAERRVQQRLTATLAVTRPGNGDRLRIAEANLGRHLGDAAASAEADVLRRALAALTRRL